MPKDTCRLCENAEPFDLPFSFAFQPIVDLPRRTVFAYEALVRGPGGTPASTVLSELSDETRYVFDQRARTKAIALASELFARRATRLSINILPNAIYDPVRCLRTTLRAARQYDFPLDQLMFEVTEQERVNDVAHLRKIVSHYSSFGFTTAIDDFGAGFSGLGFLAEFTPHVIKLDRALVREIQEDPMRQAILAGIIPVARKMNIKLIAEGVETRQELKFLLGLGIETFQGYLFATPGFECLPDVDFEHFAVNDNEPAAVMSAADT